MQVGEIKTFNYTGNVQNITLSLGKYKLECWGASGGIGNGNINPIGLGGYSIGILNVIETITLYIYVGQDGVSNAMTSSRYNGGGAVIGTSGHNGGAGGGATDFRLIDGAWNNVDSLCSRILVAGGGGGAQPSCGNTATAGHGGGLIGGTSYNQGYQGRAASVAATRAYSTGGTQTSGGHGYNINDNNTSQVRSGAFGTGATSVTCGAGGGGGWYGGGTGYTSGGGGGSSYAAGFPDCDTTYHHTHQQDIILEEVELLQAINTGNGLARITCLSLFGDVQLCNYLQNLNQIDYSLTESLYYSILNDKDIANIPHKEYEGFTINNSLQKIYYNNDLQEIVVDCYYTRNSYNLTVIGGTSSQYIYLFEEQGDLQYTREYFNDPLSKFKHWKSDDKVEIYAAFLKDTTFKMPAQDITIYAESTDQDRVNTNIYKNIFENILFDLYEIQNNITGVYKQENTIFQYKHNFDLYDLVYRDNNGLYKKGLANEEQYGVIGIISKIVNANEFVLLTFGQIEIDYNFSSDSGILYLSDTEPGKFCTYEELITNFYTPIGFYTGNTITLNILDSSVGDVLKKYHDKIYDQETFAYLTEPEKQDIIQEVLNNA